MDNNSSSPGLPEPSLLPGQSAPLTVITPTNQSGIVIIATALALVFALVSVLLRLFIRVEFRQRFAGDDVATFISMALMFIQTGLVFADVAHGLGKTGDEIAVSDRATWQKYSYVSDIFYILMLWSTKLSIVLLFLRLSPDATHNLVAHIFMGVSAVLITVSVFVVSLQCQVAEPWLVVGAQCPGLLARWQTVVSFDIISEVALFLISVYIVHGLQLALQKKFVVAFAFGLRLPMIAAAALRLHYQGIKIASPDPSLDGVMATVCADIELCWAIIATTIPCLRPFMFALSTNYGGPSATKTSPGTAATRPGYNISLGSVSTNSKFGDSAKDKDGSAPPTRWDGAAYVVDVATGDQHSMTSSDSRRMIISKNTEWAVDYENRGKEEA